MFVQKKNPHSLTPDLKFERVHTLILFAVVHYPVPPTALLIHPGSSACPSD